MVAVAKLFCIDRYEASRPDATATSYGTDNSRAQSVEGVYPWQVVSNEEAEAACESSGKRLCSPEEWQLACQGPNGTVYAYGDAYQPAVCNGIDTFGRTDYHLTPTGALPECANEWGVFDMNGNLWEYVSGGSDLTVRGGAFNCIDSATLHRCDYIPGSWAPSALGFRCCLTPGSELDGGSS
jgi:formylglycine-generating enzyme required for sulfatase activity